jgi:CRISPR-associated protein Csb3
MIMPVYAAVEFLCLVGLQRFRPIRHDDDRFHYYTWSLPLPPRTAAAAACGAVSLSSARSFAFPLLYRTKYLKGFLPATIIGDDQ